MPELPEVETMCRGILPIVGQRVSKVERVSCQRRPIAIEPRMDHFRGRTEGKTVAGIQRAGKRVVIWLANQSRTAKKKTSPQAQGSQPLGLNRHNDKGFANCPGEEAIVIEPRMTGLVLLSDPPTVEHLRFRMQLCGSDRTQSKQLLFWDRRGLGTVRLFSAADFAARFLGDSKTLGPDALAVSVEQLRQRLHGSRREIKVALLDQRALAGIGNLYASEILHLAGIHPAARCHRLKPAQWKRLHAAMLDVLHRAIKHEGSTLSDGTYRNALNEAGGYQNHHRVYDRAGQPCANCGQPIRRIVQAQRSTFFCPTCQRR